MILLLEFLGLVRRLMVHTKRGIDIHLLCHLRGSLEGFRDLDIGLTVFAKAVGFAYSGSFSGSSVLQMVRISPNKLILLEELRNLWVEYV